MIADLDETLRQLLIAELPVKNGELEISFDQPRRDWSARLSRPTINLFLYDVRENNVLRQHQWQQLNGGQPSAANLAAMKRTPMRVDLAYMLTTWAADPTDEHRLLTRLMLTLFRFPVLPRDRLVGTLRNPPFDIQARLAAHDKLTDPTDLWNVLDNDLRPCVSYVITLALDPWSEVTGPIVRTLTLRRGLAEALPHAPRLRAEGVGPDMVYIGGAVRDKDGTPQAGLQVAVKGTGLFSTTDADGRFVLGSLSPGEVTLVVWPPAGDPVQKTVAVPAPDGAYDLEV